MNDGSMVAGYVIGEVKSLQKVLIGTLDDGVNASGLVMEQPVTGPGFC